MPLTEKGEEIKKALVEEYGEKKGEQVLYAGKNKGTFTGIDAMSNDAESYRPATAMTHQQINQHNKQFWSTGPADSEASAPMLSGTKVSTIPVYQHDASAEESKRSNIVEPETKDEVSPTQSSPPDRRSDNLLTREHGGIPGTE